MKKLFIIVQREYLTRIRSKAFIILTLLMPVIMIMMVVVPLLLSRIKTTDTQTVGIIDQTGLYAGDIKDNEQFRFVVTDSEKNDSEILATIIISDTLSINPKAIKIVSSQEPNPGLIMYVENVLNNRIYQDKINNSGIPELRDIINKLNEKISIQTVKVTDDGEERDSSMGALMGVGFVFTMLIYMFVIIYGNMVLQSALEEKTSRVVEIMVSSVKPFTLMLGKMIGIFMVGLTQLSVWGIFYLLLMGIASSAVPESNAKFHEILGAINSLPMFEITSMFILYFIGGFLLFGSIFAAVGASTNSQEEAQQFNSPLMMITVFGLYAAIYSVENTNGPLAFWASLFPLTSPMAMMIRIPFGVPVWEELLSIALLYASAFGMLWIGAKIYRIGILMYGKKPTLKEIMKWINYK